MKRSYRPTLGTTAMALALATAAIPTAASAQSTGQPDPADTPAEQAGAGGGEGGEEDEIVVTGSRIQRAGFDQPTPTTVIGDVELRQGARANIAQVLNDQPQFRATVSPQTQNGVTTGTGVAPVDLRGLGTARTLTLLDGRRFVGENNLNLLPTGLVERLEVVTGGASAAWGSNAVAGVVNVILKRDVEGLTVGAQSGVSSRGDGFRYGFDGTFGTKFAGDDGRFIVGVEYVDDQGVRDRNSRRNLGSAGIVRVNPLNPADLSTVLARDVNFGNQARDGLITSGVLAGQVFNQDGTLRPFRGGVRLGAAAFPGQMLGGEDGVGLYDEIAVSTPFERLASYARVSYDVGDATVYLDGTYGRATSDAPFLVDFLVPPLTISAANPFLAPGIRSQLAAAGQSGFTLGRFFTDVFRFNYDSKRENFEGAIGIDGTFGGGRFKYSAYYSHGELKTDNGLQNSRVAANFTRAINAVTNASGQIVCAVNADANPANDDPACSPLNPFGRFNASAASIDYVTGTQRTFSTAKLDAASAQVQGDLFDLWAGPVTVVIGAESRWEELSSSRNADAVAGIFGIPVFTSDLAGGFDVQEGFGEIALPLLDVEGTVKFDVSGAARYSDFSTSGGIWSWKAGGTLRLFDDLLLRATRSRDIRSPNITNLFSARRINVGPLNDLDFAGRTATDYTRNPQAVTTFSGGNPDLDQERARTLVLGGSFSPSFLPGFDVSIDYYKIDIRGAIFTLNGSQLTQACAGGNTAACDQVVRNPTTGTVETVFSNEQNIARFETNGFDIEASYFTRLSAISDGLPGTIRVRALATHIRDFVVDTGITRVDSAGDVGDAVANSIPSWRGTLSFTYQDDAFGLDVRARYVDGGTYNSQATTLVNNRIGSRTYVDIGAQLRVDDRFTFFGNVNNLFDRETPISPVGSPHYDAIGTYLSVGARASF